MLDLARKILKKVRIVSYETIPHREEAKELEQKISQISLKDLVSAYVLGEYYQSTSDPMRAILGAIYLGYPKKINLEKVLEDRKVCYANVSMMFDIYVEKAVKEMSGETDLETVTEKFLSDYFLP